MLNMPGVFDEEDLEPVRPRRDTELTLGSGTLLAIFFGLVLLCGLCFGLGYALGHRGMQSTAVAEPGASAPQPLAGGSTAKPSAGAQTPAAPIADIATASATNAPQAAALPAGTAQTAPAQTVSPGKPSPQPIAQPAASGLQPQVHAAFNSGNSSSPAAVQPNGAVHAALGPTGSFVVQIAAV